MYSAKRLTLAAMFTAFGILLISLFSKMPEYQQKSLQPLEKESASKEQRKDYQTQEEQPLKISVVEESLEEGSLLKELSTKDIFQMNQFGRLQTDGKGYLKFNNNALIVVEDLLWEFSQEEVMSYQDKLVEAVAWAYSKHAAQDFRVLIDQSLNYQTLLSDYEIANDNGSNFSLDELYELAVQAFGAERAQQLYGERMFDFNDSESLVQLPENIEELSNEEFDEFQQTLTQEHYKILEEEGLLNTNRPSSLY